MNFNIFTEYSLWFILLLLIFAGLAAWFLYYNDKKLSEIGKSKLILLAVLRFFTVFFISFFLLSPVIKYVKYKLEKPKIIFVQDNSESIKLVKNQSSNTPVEYIKQLEYFISETKKEYDFSIFSFGNEFNEGLNYDFDRKTTNFNNIFEKLQSKFINQNVGALIIASDGIYNAGSNPTYQAKDLNYPIYTIALGDTAKKRDIILKSVYTNKMAFLGDFFPVEIMLNAIDYKDKEVILKIENKSQTVYSKIISITNNDFSKLISVNIEAKEKGLQYYKVSVSYLKSEFNRSNNYSNFVIDVVDDKTKVLILANSVHPDITAIKQALRFDKNYEVDFFSIDNFNNNIDDYQLIIFHQLPSSTFNVQKLVRKINKKQIPILFILGTQTDVRNFNLLKTDLQILKNSSNIEEVNPKFNTDFKLFEFDNNFANIFKNTPPLNAPFGEYKVNAYSETLFFQKILGITTEKPLIFFINDLSVDKAKQAFICGEGIWKWRINNFTKAKNFNAFDALIGKIVHFLSLNIKKDRLMLFSKNIYKENEDIIIKANFYNESYELYNEPELNLQLINSENKKFNYKFLKSKNAYFLNLGKLKNGTYKFIATTKFKEKTFSKSEKFSVSKINIESVNLVANHKLLYQMANESGGKMFYPNQLKDLLKDLKSNNKIVTVSHSSTSLIDLINLKWLFFVIVFFISTEWFLRKFFGSY